MLRAEGAPPTPPAPAPVGSSRGSRGSRAPAAKGAKPASSATVGSHAAPPAPPSCSHLLGSIHAEGIPLAARAAVGEQELAVWAALASSSSSGGGDGAAAAECAQLASFLTEQAFPAKSCPVEHARILLAAYQAGAGAVGRSDAQLLAHAAAVLEGSKQVRGRCLLLPGWHPVLYGCGKPDQNYLTLGGLRTAAGRLWSGGSGRQGARPAGAGCGTRAGGVERTCTAAAVACCRLY